MLSHGIVNASHVAGLLSSIDGVTNAIDVQVAENKGDLKQEIVIISQLHVINLQQLRDLDCLALRWDTTDICSIHQEECKSILIEMEMMQKMRTPVPYGGFPLMNLKFKTWLHLKMLIGMETPWTNASRPPPCQLQWSGNQHVCFSNTMTSSRRFAPHLPFDWAFSSASYWSCDWSPWTYVCNNIADIFCKGHLDDILALFFYHIKLATLKEDNTVLILG
jgi:hypothetical protein